MEQICHSDNVSINQLRGFFNLKNEIKGCQNKIAEHKWSLVKYQLGIINNLITDDEEPLVDYIFKNLKQDFPKFLLKELKDYKAERDFLVFVQNQINHLRHKSHNNFLILVWLDIIDLSKLVYVLYQQYQQENNPHLLQEMEEQKQREVELQQKEGQIGEMQDQQIIIEQDEREQDYYEYRFKNNQDFDHLWDIINELFNPLIAGDNFIDCETIQDCLQKQSMVQFQQDEGFDPEMHIQGLLQYNLFTEVGITESWQVNNFILGQLQHSITTKINYEIEVYERKCKEKDELDALSAQGVFKWAEVMAMTTTGRAKYNKLLEGVEFPIIIVEEAAEVFEAHILASLSKRTKHLILIGDHEQLRPNPARYDLSLNYNLSMSMFERLVNNEVQHSTLNIQRRMRPEISEMMKYIYPDLRDHESVKQYPDIKGIMSNLFFFDHQFQESTNDLMQSKVNIKEAEFVVRFTQYLLQHSYLPEKITILTLYAGQLLKIKQLIKDDKFFKDKFIRVVNVDNYQGEENDIIILSLVRSNMENRIGFLKITNRVCVALSRAKHGLYIFGNSKCILGSKEQLWIDVVDYLQRKQLFGNELGLKCVNHGKVATIKTISDFSLVPQGGCTLGCDTRMECGHVCPQVCHPYYVTDTDIDGHSKIKCLQPCVRERTCTHKCTYKCFQCKTGHQPCLFKLDKIMTPCGHTMKVTCDDFVRTIRCMNPCEKKLPRCGHQCSLSCHMDCYARGCRVQITVELPQCGHTVEKDCSTELDQVWCHHQCQKLLPCGHPCPSKCGECFKKGEHGRCDQDCKTNLICGHQCNFPCTKNCPPCAQAACLTKCSHSQCRKLCKQPCVMCKQPCDNACKHTQCSKLCSEPCDRDPCNLPCDVILKCGHQCIGLCGEICPTICKICNSDNIAFEIFYGFEQDEDMRFIQIDCGHVFPFTALDKHMELNQDQNERVQFKRCPRCRQFIMKCRRYMNQINQVLIDINLIKIKILEEENEFQHSQNLVKQEMNRLFNEVKKNITDKNQQRTLRELLNQQSRQLKEVEHQRSSELLNDVINTLNNYISKLIIVIKHSTSPLVTYQEAEKVNKLLVLVQRSFKWTNLTKEAMTETLEVFEYFKNKANFAEEMDQIAKAVGLHKGHWNKCPNGHFYLIADCGGANQVSRCPDCQAVIGGTNHQLAAGNQFASELGGQSMWNPNGFNAQVAAGNINLQDIVHD